MYVIASSDLVNTEMSFFDPQNYTKNTNFTLLIK